MNNSTTYRDCKVCFDKAAMLEQLNSILPSIQDETDLKACGSEPKGTCPFCGGTDRFWISADGKGHCRQCTPGTITNYSKIDFHCKKNGFPESEWWRLKDIYLPGGDIILPAQPVTSLMPAPPPEPPPDQQDEWDNRCFTQRTEKQVGVIYDLLCGLRKIDPAVVDNLIRADCLRFKTHCNVKSIAMAYRSLADGKIYAIQYLTSDGQPYPFTLNGGKPANKVFGGGHKAGAECFFLAGDIQTAKQLIICESAINAITAYKCFPDACCLALGGSTNVAKVKALKPYYDSFERIVICGDKDDASEKMIQAIYRELVSGAGINRLFAISFSHDDPEGYDINDLLKAGQKQRIIDLVNEAGLVTAPLQGDGQAKKSQSLPIPLPDELTPVMPFDYELLPDRLRPWVKDIAERMQCPPDFVAASAMAAMAAVIGRKVGIRPQAKTDWTVVCNLWALVVGRPGVLKSPSQEAGLSPLKRLIASANERYNQDLETHKTDAIAAKLRKEAAEKKARKVLQKDPSADIKTVLAVGEDPASPVLKRYQANDSTPASLGELLRQNPNGLLVFRDEVVSLLKSLDREGQEEGRGFYLTAWNGDSPYTFDRIGRGLNLHIPALCISLLGGTQPGRLSEYIHQAVKGGSADDGLIQRFGLLIWPDLNGTWKNVDRHPDTAAKNRAFQVFEDLDRLNPAEIGAEQDTDFEGQPEGIPYLRFDPPSLELFSEWRTTLEAKLRSDLHPALESHFAKYRKLIPSLALIIHLADGGNGPVSEGATLRALAWGEYLETHAERAYSSVSNADASTAKAILRRIKKGDLKPPFSTRDVWRPGWSKLSDRDQVVGGLRMLEDYRHIYIERVNTNGRPKMLYHLNEVA